MVSIDRSDATVTAYVSKLSPERAVLADAIRQAILKAHKQIGEQIKWNAPAFFFTGEMKPFDPKEYKRDIVVFNLRQKDHILLIFPTGAKLTDNSGLLEGVYTDGRRMVRIKDLADLKSKAKDLKRVINEWVDLVDRA